MEFQLQFHITTTVYQNNVVHNLGGNHRGGTSSGVTFTTNLERTGAAATTFVTPGTPRISCRMTGTPAWAICQAASDPARPPPMTWTGRGEEDVFDMAA